MRFLYLGLPLGATVLLRAGHVPVACVIGHPDAPGMPRLRRRLPRETLLLGRPSLSDPAVRDALLSTRYDALLSWFWPKRIPIELIRAAPRGAFGVHPSLLPRWRGPDPYFHAIAAGDHTTGVSLHRLEADYDTGAVIARVSVPIRDDDTAWTLARRLDRPSLGLLVTCADVLDAGLSLGGEAQDPALVTEAPPPGEEELALRFVDEDADALCRRVRAAAPEPGASALLEETLVTVQRARPWRGAFPSALRAGEAFVAPEGVVVRARSGGVLLERVRVEDDDEVLEGAEIAQLLG
ncbi:methionyl-tRNA formyltransferase [Sandaracinus amylolyticus]|uniref:methionyl-tRNA formyltransferase n=1 Tax=Sandaracinus amylolyticus TaxID=927083 RepID=UPI001F3716D0|nr:formyltransferase family protein [Sandaracinus amylolyticus]UJR81602.1 Methionyl-tRNA formyltransferase [Sandaracinus amylolyticus]